MNIVHFDVDPELDKFLDGNKCIFSLQKVTKDDDFSEVDVISIKTASAANEQSLVHFPRLELLISRTVGTDHIDLEYCKKNHIAVYHIVDYGAFNIAEHVFALLLSGTRNILSTQDDIAAGRFSYAGHLGFALQGKTLGVVGTGRIGLEVIKRANAFDMTVIAYDVYKNEKAREELGFTYVELDELAKNADVISLHAPLLDSTRHMINAPLIKKMKQNVILINTARGELIDTAALIRSIKKFRWVGLDVLEGEKEFSANHPLLTHKNIVITPHLAFYSDSSVKKIAEETMRLVQNFENGNEEGKVT